MLPHVGSQAAGVGTGQLQSWQLSLAHLGLVLVSPPFPVTPLSCCCRAPGSGCVLQSRPYCPGLALRFAVGTCVLLMFTWWPGGLAGVLVFCGPGTMLGELRGCVTHTRTHARTHARTQRGHTCVELNMHRCGTTPSNLRLPERCVNCRSTGWARRSTISNYYISKDLSFKTYSTGSNFSQFRLRDPKLKARPPDSPF